MTLPGIGPYTAGVTVAVAASRPAGFVDAGVARLLSRYFGLGSCNTVDWHSWELTRAIVKRPPVRIRAWGLIDLARTVCRPHPDCPRCPLRSHCAHLASCGLREP